MKITRRQLRQLIKENLGVDKIVNQNKKVDYLSHLDDDDKIVN